MRFLFHLRQDQLLYKVTLALPASLSSLWRVSKSIIQVWVKRQKDEKGCWEAQTKALECTHILITNPKALQLFELKCFCSWNDFCISTYTFFFKATRYLVRIVIIPSGGIVLFIFRGILLFLDCKCSNFWHNSESNLVFVHKAWGLRSFIHYHLSFWSDFGLLLLASTSLKRHEFFSSGIYLVKLWRPYRLA